jgi:GT2 family glycosyltransferase
VSLSVVDIDLAYSVKEDLELPGYDKAFILLRYSGKPVGVVKVGLKNQKLAFGDIVSAIQDDVEVRYNLEETVLANWLLKNVRVKKLKPISWSVVVCTRERPNDLMRCLESICSNLPPGGEVIVVDNAPSSDNTRKIVDEFPVGYLVEERIGLNWARSKGAKSAKGEVVIFTDDDVVVDKRWISSILEPFENPRVAAVTGLIMPLELETSAQVMFETYGGFSRGFRKRSFDYQNIAPPAAGYVGAGANMAIRRELIRDMKLFEAELDAGTSARTGGDAYAFYQLLSAGFQIEYNPEALVFHRHRREYSDLKKTLGYYSIGGFAFLTRCFFIHKDWSALAIAISWVWQDHCHQFARSILWPWVKSEKRLPLDLVTHQIFSIPRGIWAHFSSIRREKDYRVADDENVKTVERAL